jgi:hypothetical protein
MIPEIYHDQLFGADIVAMSKRIAEAARKAGFNNKVEVSKLQTDQGLYDAVVNILE